MLVGKRVVKVQPGRSGYTLRGRDRYWTTHESCGPVFRLVVVVTFVSMEWKLESEFLIDHAFTVPLTFVRPDMDLPIVPIWTNVMAPPVPTRSR